MAICGAENRVSDHRPGAISSQTQYNPASQIRTLNQSNDGYTFTGHYNVNRSYATNGLNQYQAAGPASFSYDANGNLTSDGTTSYGYDVENRLVTTSAGASLVYDPNGRLFQVSRAGQTTRFVYDGDQLGLEYDGAGNVQRRFMFANVDEPILEDTGNALNCSGTRVLHTNHQGSIIAQADCWGNRTNVNAYDEYGIPQAGNVGRFQYTGQAWLPEIGMYYYKARIYSPTLGRFLQTDPIGYEDQVNLYAYVANDPVNGTDPTGTEGEWREKIAQLTEKVAARVVETTKTATNIVTDVPRQAAALQKATVTAAETKAATAIAENIDVQEGQQAAVNKVINIGNNNASYKDFVGAARETAGISTGYDHVTEMKQSIRGLDAKAGDFKNWALTTKGLDLPSRAGLLSLSEYATRLADRMRDTLDNK